MRIRDTAPEDLRFLEEMWHVAAFWRPEAFVLEPEAAIQIPEVARYIVGWGRAGDAAVVAEQDGRLLGAAWYRLFSATEPGYGFVAEDVPELAVGVVADARGRGIGTALLEALLDRARREGLDALSLSVNEDNPSRRIYLRCGFEDVSYDEGSYVMIRELV